MKSLQSQSSLLGGNKVTRRFVGLFLFLATLVFVNGQTGRREGFHADIPFGFQVGTTALPAGAYSFVFDEQARRVSVSDDSKKEWGRLSVITRLGSGASKESAVLVFDKLNEIRVLSEVWIPGIDGILVHATNKEHSHEVVRVVVQVALR